ncbi:SDR family oxidoreductase [Rufibacter hautae]|uniref:SDR family oxidoreductase n=1 Tax=Rufibacter hautae TaxID=2595005 RepID=A0A5B6TCF4_9BACT|nr:SDR family oxidoreductase [Rufibacter hautae]KAA3438149.1 SDR family oxidoreductase [Rufibacter hautae]
MNYSLKPLNEQVIVITGASSGIGLATAQAAAKKGAKVVLAARNREALAQIEQEIRNEGGEAIHVAADVGRWEQVQWIADAALRHFGRIDTWVNDAGVSIYGRLSQVSDEDNKRLFDTNFWGVVYGSLAAAYHMRGKGGAIINVGSELSDVAIQVQGMYSASKHAVKGFTDALRIELLEDQEPISVTLIKPAGIDTPYPEHAKNYTGQVQTLPAPVYMPEEVANAILHAAENPHRDIMVGGGAKVMSTLNKRIPGVMDWVSAKMMTKGQLKEEADTTRKDSLHRPGSDGRVHGNHDGYVMKTSLYTRAVMHPKVTSALALAAGAAVYALINNSKRKGQTRSNGTHLSTDEYQATSSYSVNTTYPDNTSFAEDDRFPDVNNAPDTSIYPEGGRI